jgi:hypothetical protein
MASSNAGGTTMASESEELYEALATRDKVRGYLSNLERLRTEGSVTEEQYATAKNEYIGQESAASSAIDSLKAQLKPRLDGIERELADARFQLGSFETRLRVGEITQAKHDAEHRKLGTQIEALEASREELANLLAAEMAPARQVHSAVATKPSKLPATEETAPKKRALPPREPDESRPRFSAKGIAESKPRLVALVCSVLLLVSVRLAWLGPSDMMASGTPPTPGVATSFFVGIAGLFGGLVAIGVAFVSSGRARGIVHICLGIFAIAALGAGIGLGELPLHNSYFRALIVLREGFFVYVAMGIALVVLGIIEKREG